MLGLDTLLNCTWEGCYGEKSLLTHQSPDEEYQEDSRRLCVPLGFFSAWLSVRRGYYIWPTETELSVEPHCDSLRRLNQDKAASSCAFSKSSHQTSGLWKAASHYLHKQLSFKLKHEINVSPEFIITNVRKTSQ